MLTLDPDWGCRVQERLHCGEKGLDVVEVHFDLCRLFASLAIPDLPDFYFVISIFQYINRVP
jgi:hypothetical protein